MAGPVKCNVGSPSPSYAERLSTNGLPDDHVGHHDELRVDDVSGRWIWPSQSWVRRERVTLTRTRNFVRLIKLENQLGKQVSLLPPLLIDLADEVVVGVRNTFHLTC